MPDFRWEPEVATNATLFSQLFSNGNLIMQVTRLDGPGAAYQARDLTKEGEPPVGVFPLERDARRAAEIYAQERILKATA